MTLLFPLKFREFQGGKYIIANEAGDWVVSNRDFVQRVALDQLAKRDRAFLKDEGFAADDVDDFHTSGYLQRWAKRQANPKSLNYLLLVPTLRCDLDCSYCQVSRVSARARRFDWSDETLQGVLDFLGNLESRSIKIEFQGGEPTLRIDLLNTVARFCRENFEQCEFVVCTNLQSNDAAVWEFFDAADVKISTSLDGSFDTHTRQRTKDAAKTSEFLKNLKMAIARYGPEKVSALPTIDVSVATDPAELCDAYAEVGLSSVFFRPINFQGFARKRHAASIDNFALWKQTYFSFLDHLIDQQLRGGPGIDEYYFVHCLRRFLQPGHDAHVDLRNPAPFGKDAIVIDFDGSFYPSDEARMLTRIGQVNLSIGHVRTGIDHEKLDELNWSSLNNVHEDCIHCPYQFACGTDLVDDLSRYQRIDLPKSETWFCRQHLAIFDRIASDLASNNRRVLSVYEKWLGLPNKSLSDNVRRYDPAHD